MISLRAALRRSRKARRARRVHLPARASRRHPPARNRSAPAATCLPRARTWGLHRATCRRHLRVRCPRHLRATCLRHLQVRCRSPRRARCRRRLQVSYRSRRLRATPPSAMRRPRRVKCRRLHRTKGKSSEEDVGPSRMAADYIAAPSMN
jgi:hypothetical protein